MAIPVMVGASGSACAADASKEFFDATRPVITGGYGANTAIFGIGAEWPVAWRREALAQHDLEFRLGADLMRWEGREKVQDNGASWLWNAGLTPYLRWRPGTGAWKQAFVQGGVGVQFVSQTLFNNSRDFGSHFQFGERFAVGFNPGAGARYEVTAFIQHVSNAGLSSPNAGITFYGATLSASLD